MKKYFTIFFALVCLHSTKAQLLHIKSMRCFVADFKTSLVNVYDVKKETLIKSINCGETTLSQNLGFNKEETNLFRVGIQYAYIIDVNSLETKKFKLYTDEDTAVQNYAKLQALIDAEVKRVKKEAENADNIVGGNLPAFTETSEMKKIKSLPLFISTMGLTENGIVVSKRIFTNKIEFNVFDLNQAGKKVNSFELPNGSCTALYKEYILVFVQDGSINILDPLTAKNIGKIDNAFTAKDLADAKTVTAAYENKNIDATLSPYGNYLITGLSLGLVPNTANTNYAFSIYDFTSKKIIYNYRGTDMLTNILPIAGTTYFQKPEAKTPMPFLQLPPAPDFTKFKPKDIANGAMTKALQDYQEETSKAQAAWKLKFDAYKSPQNFSTKVFADVNATQEIFSVDAARYVGIVGDYIICGKDVSWEFYDLKSKALLHTIYY
jgi:hypothetical protein